MSVIATSALLLALATAGPAGLSDPEALEHFKRGQELYNEEQYTEAAVELSKAYELESSATILYGWAHSERKAGNCEKAVELYQQFLDSDPTEKYASSAREHLETCESELAAQAEVEQQAEETSEAIAEQAEDEPPPPKKKDRARAWYKDPTGGVLVGLGVVGVAVGAGLIASASSDKNKADDTSSHDDFVSFEDSARIKQGVAIGSFVVGGALLIGGIIRYVVVAKKAKKATAFRLQPTIGGVVITGRF